MIYLSENATKREGDTRRKKSSIHCFTPSDGCNGQAMSAAGTQALRPSSDTFPGPLIGNWFRSRATGILTGAYMEC